ncbi:MAG: uroporphyrinogen decarboxylase family protein [Desulfobacterales bacterium]
MTDSFEIVDGFLRKKSVARMGLFDLPWPDTLRKWVEEQGYPEDKGRPMAPGKYFGFDMVGCGGWFDLMPLRGHWEALEETDEWIVTRNGAGASLKNWKRKSGTPEHIDFRMTSREIWEKDYRPHLIATDPHRLNIVNDRASLQKTRAKGRWAFFGNLFIFEQMRSSLGDMCMFESMLLDPDWIHDFNRVYTDFYKAHYALLFKEAGIPDGIWIYEDMGYSRGLFCSPKTLEKLFFPYYKEIVDFFHSYDLPVVLHTCGGITDALPLIVDAGFDALNPMEVKAGCDAVAFAETYGDKLAFVGGLDARILESGDRSEIEREVTRICTGMKACGGRYLFGSDHSLSTNVDLADFEYAVQVYKEQMMY